MLFYSIQETLWIRWKPCCRAIFWITEGEKWGDDIFWGVGRPVDKQILGVIPFKGRGEAASQGMHGLWGFGKSKGTDSSIWEHSSDNINFILEAHWNPWFSQLQYNKCVLFWVIGFQPLVHELLVGPQKFPAGQQKSYWHLTDSSFQLPVDGGGKVEICWWELLHDGEFAAAEAKKKSKCSHTSQSGHPHLYFPDLRNQKCFGKDLTFLCQTLEQRSINCGPLPSFVNKVLFVFGLKVTPVSMLRDHCWWHSKDHACRGSHPSQFHARQPLYPLYSFQPP